MRRETSGVGSAAALMLATLTLATASTALAQGGQSRENARVLAFGGEVRIQETDVVFLTQPADIALAANGRVYVSEPGEGRVMEIATSGRITRLFGRKGRGPGELAAASTLGLAGDSLLLVWDRGGRRLTSYSLRSGDFERSVRLSISWPPAIRVAGSEILLTMYDPASASTVLRLSAAGDSLGREGPLPALLAKHPIFAEGGFSGAAFAVSGQDVYAAFELSPSLYRWTRGSKHATAAEIPAVRRRGVKTANFEQMLGDPGNGALIQKLMYNRSIPVALDVVAPDIVGLVTVDFDMQWEKRERGTTYYLSLLDVARNLACVDIAVPASRELRPDREAIPFVTLRGTTLVILQQDVDAKGESLATIRRFRIDPAECTWVSVRPPGS